MNVSGAVGDGAGKGVPRMESPGGKGEGEKELARPGLLEKQEKEVSDVGLEELAEGAPLVNGQEAAAEEASRNPVAEEPPPAKEEETVLKEDDEEEFEPPVFQDVGVPETCSQEQLPTECDSTETFASLPNSTISDPEVAETAGGGGPPEAAPKAQASPSHPAAAPDFYCVKWINWKGERTPIITQSENGPCPLLAIMNILFLQWKVRAVQSLQLQEQSASGSLWPGGGQAVREGHADLGLCEGLGMLFGKPE